MTVSTVICPIEWDLATTILNGRAAQLNEELLQFIECENPGVFFESIPHCCSNAGRFHVFVLMMFHNSHTRQITRGCLHELSL